MSKDLFLRCPRLGGEVTLRYCLRESEDLPCGRTIRCWEPFLPIESWLRERLTPEQWQKCFHGETGGGGKLGTILGCIEKAGGRG